MNQLPEEGAQVSAITYASLEYNRTSREVSGKLTFHKSPFGGLPQCFVDGLQVDPTTVKAAAPRDQEGAQPAPEGAPAGGMPSPA